MRPLQWDAPIRFGGGGIDALQGTALASRGRGGGQSRRLDPTCAGCRVWVRSSTAQEAARAATTRRLLTMPRVGPITAIAIETFAPPMKVFDPHPPRRSGPFDEPRPRRDSYLTTGPFAFLQAFIPPEMWRAVAIPACCTASTAMAERSPYAQYAIEEHSFSRGLRQFMQYSALRDVLLQCGVGSMQRAGD